MPIKIEGSQSKYDNEDLVFLLNVANDFRRARRGTVLDELPKSTPQDADHCIIANAFNQGCTVVPDAYGENGTITFYNVEDAEAYAHLVPESEKLDENEYTLPENLNQLAIDFDHGRFPEVTDDEYINDEGEVIV